MVYVTVINEHQSGALVAFRLSRQVPILTW